MIRLVRRSVTNHISSVTFSQIENDVTGDNSENSYFSSTSSVSNYDEQQRPQCCFLYFTIETHQSTATADGAKFVFVKKLI